MNFTPAHRIPVPPDSGLRDDHRTVVSVCASAGTDYNIHVGAGAMSALNDSLEEVAPAARYVIISDSNVAPLHGERVLASIRSGGLAADLLSFPAGEAHKTRESWADLSDRMLALGAGRDTTVLALGGGVTGDLAGFVAATYMRGVPLVQLPTSLLAMVDSSVGGKTGVDAPAGKNLIGAFHQPSIVLADTDVLATLPMVELRNGLAEAVKHGAIADADYFASISEDVDALLALDPAKMAALVRRSVEIKAAVVAADEREGGLRKTLNFGHTVGHAIESLSGFELMHGQSIAIGAVVEAHLGEMMGVTDAGTMDRLRETFTRCGLPTRVPTEFAADDILELARSDKKARAGRVEYSLIERIGRSAPGDGGYSIPVEDDFVGRSIEACKG